VRNIKGILRKQIGYLQDGPSTNYIAFEKCPSVSKVQKHAIRRERKNKYFNPLALFAQEISNDNNSSSNVK
jgi:hypothetical protein